MIYPFTYEINKTTGTLSLTVALRFIKLIDKREDIYSDIESGLEKIADVFNKASINNLTDVSIRNELAALVQYLKATHLEFTYYVEESLKNEDN